MCLVFFWHAVYFGWFTFVYIFMTLDRMMCGMLLRSVGVFQCACRYVCLYVSVQTLTLPVTRYIPDTMLIFGIPIPWVKHVQTTSVLATLTLTL